MENYADYEFYRSQYMGSLSNDLFDSLIVKASREIDRNVNCDIEKAKLTEKEQWQLQYVACELVDYLNNNGTNAESSAGSISIDGVSITKYENSEYTTNNKHKILGNLPIKLTRYL